jgi:exosortase/archaeosortase family protein
MVQLLQHGSAHVAYWLFLLSGVPVHLADLVLYLPGITLRVAPECSGLNSTLALFLISLLAGKLFLRGVGRRVLLSVWVVPLGLLRNGFRIFTIGQLCIHLGPEMIDSDLHRHGGPVFFILSLIPFFMVLVLLRRKVRRNAA